jgi:small subunit ribosomal protein S2
MTKTPDVAKMFKTGMHFGHKSSKWHPKIEPYIFTKKDNIHIINLAKTGEKLKEAALFAQGVAERGGKILFVGVKKQSKSVVVKYAKECGMPYMSGKWIGGLLTNFSTIIKSARRYKILMKKKASGELEKYTKKERSQFDKEIEKLEKTVGGIVEMDSFPQAIFLLDMKKAKTALQEANKKKLPIIAICDTNCNPGLVNYPIPANDDSIKSVELIVATICEAIKGAKVDGKKDGEIKKLRN